MARKKSSRSSTRRKSSGAVKRTEKEPAPLTAAQVSRNRALRPTKKAPRVDVNLATFRVPRGAKPVILKVRGKADTYRLSFSTSEIHIKQSVPFDRIPTQKPTRTKLSARALKRAEIGLRPDHVAVKFTPKRVKLSKREQAHPPAGYKYPRGVDRPTNVFVPDQRFIYLDNSFPWRTVGRVTTPLGTCTGCTIGSRLLLTANHCIQWNSGGTAGWVRFEPMYYNGPGIYGAAWATRVIHWIQTTPANGLTDSETAFDYVVCVLDRRIGDTVGFAGYRTYSNGWNGGSFWQHMGYPSDLTGSQRPAFQGNCAISSVGNQSTVGRTGFVLGHFNDVVGGHSGGPVWGWWSNEPWPRVVGVQSAEANTPAFNTAGDNEFGGGPALSELITWARANYP